MTSILIPTDFSLNAQVALRYAVAIADHFQAEIKMLHVYQAPVIDTNMAASTLGQEKQGQEKAHLQKMEEQLQAIAPEKQVECIVEEGEVIPTIEKVVEDYYIDNVVMGTRGATESSGQGMGSITSEVIYRLTCPVLAIPVEAVFNPIQKIVFAVDFEDYNNNTLNQLRDFAAHFEAELVLLHVNPEAGYFDPEHIKNYKKIAEDLLAYDNMHFEFFGEEDVMDTINWYVEEKGADILAILSHRKETLRKVYQQSYTRALALHTTVPLLVFHD